MPYTETGEDERSGVGYVRRGSYADPARQFPERQAGATAMFDLDRPLSVGIYAATDTFGAIGAHEAVMFDDDSTLVAAVGPAGDEASINYAWLFAAAPLLLAALRGVIEAADGLVQSAGSDEAWCVAHVAELAALAAALADAEGEIEAALPDAGSA